MNETLADRLGRQEEDSRQIFQLTYGDMDTDNSKTISQQEFVLTCSVFHARNRMKCPSLSPEDLSFLASFLKKDSTGETGHDA